MSEIATAGCTITFTDVTIQAGNIQIITPPSDKVFINGNGVYFDSIDVLLTALTKGGLTCPTGTITIEGTADNFISPASSSGKKALQKGDKGSATLTFYDSDSDPHAVDVEIEITDAGQTDVTAS